jgi:hypothetical protein
MGLLADRCDIDSGTSKLNSDWNSSLQWDKDKLGTAYLSWGTLARKSFKSSVKRILTRSDAQHYL